MDTRLSVNVWKKHAPLLFLLLLFFCDGSTVAQSTESLSLHEIQSQFVQPPIDCWPHTRWWWMGNAVTKDEITWQLGEMFDKGIGGVEQITMGSVYEKGNVPYLSSEFIGLLKHTVKTAKRLGMDVSLNFGGPGWVIGGAWVPLEDRSKCLVPTFIDLEGPTIFSANLPIQLRSPEHSWELPIKEITSEDQLTAVVACRLIHGRLDETSTIVLTSNVKNRVLSWNVPDGQWRVMAFWVKYTGQGDTVDHFNRSAMRRYCDTLGNIFYKAFGDEFGKTVDSLFCDSFEVALAPNGIYWTNGLLEEFRQRKEYDLTPFLPAIWWDMGEITPKIRHDVNEFLHEIGMEAFF